MEDLNRFQKPDRAAFIGDEVHGYDSAYYNEKGWPIRIFFDSRSGKRYNERKYEYDSLSEKGEWITRRKIMGDTIQEYQLRAFNFEKTDENNVFFPVTISSTEFDENVISFTENEDMAFFTRGKEWQKQVPYISKMENGIYTFAERIQELDTIL